LTFAFTTGCGSDDAKDPVDDGNARMEGTEPGDCNDDADNDADGLFDCDDDGCEGSDLCDETESPPDATAPVLETTRGSIAADNLEFASFPGVVGVPNLDDDDENGESDWEQGGLAEGENDFSLANLTTNGNGIELALTGSGIRIYSDEGLILSEDTESTFAVSGETEELALRIEFSDFSIQGSLAVRVDAGGDDFEVALTASPLFFNHALQPAEQTMAVTADGLGNDAMISTFESVLGDAFFAIDAEEYGYDVWVRDEFQFGYATSPDAHVDVVFDTLRDRGLDALPEDLYQQPDWVILDFGGDPSAVTTYDSAGNIAVSPPVSVDGVDYPYGRIYFGGNPETGEGPLFETRDALASSTIQAPFMIDTSWLCVGHVNAVAASIPDPSAPKGFRFLISDTRTAWELLESMDPTTLLPKYGSLYGYGTVDALISNDDLRAFNAGIQTTLNEQEDGLRAQLGLDDEDIIRVPALFESLAYCDDYAGPLMPALTSLLVSNTEEQTMLFFADPFLRADGSDPETDPMIAAVRSLMPDSLEVLFVDDWDAYHQSLGNVGSGTNVKRTAPRTWWNDGGHLFAGE
jgi:protein-arginine deiminase